MDREAKTRELESLRTRVRQLESELREPGAVPEEPVWPPREFYTAYYILAGFLLGGVAALASLLFNVVGSVIVGKPPLYLIQVYLTFPLGERAAENLDSGLALAVGVTLYLLTGMVLGMPFHLILSRWFEATGAPVKFAVATVLGLVLWAINFYVLLPWLQPALFGGNWIVEKIPWWVACSTHLVFGWTMFAMQPLGKFVVARQ